ncbi:hypothetical protein L1887_42325 [Cichorium endivia]|nr:hypothetical protein L1887_42325 [Cichorium endivia]
MLNPIKQGWAQIDVIRGESRRRRKAAGNGPARPTQGPISLHCAIDLGSDSEKPAARCASLCTCPPDPWSAPGWLTHLPSRSL